MRNVKNRLIAILLVLSVCLLSAAGAAADGYAATVTGGWLRLRDAPSYDSHTLASYFTGTKVTVLSSSNGWSYVRVSDGHVGYMASSYLTTGSVTPSSGGSISAVGYVTSSNGGRVALRTGAGKSYPVITYCNVGTSLTVLNAGSVWDRVQVGSSIGYMMAKYITFNPSGITPPSPSSTAKAYVTSANGKSVNLRSGAGMNYAILGSFYVGTEVTVLSEGATWNYVQVSGLKGYMMRQYLTSTKPSAPPPTTPVSPTIGSTAYVTSSNGKAVRLRSGPGTGYPVIGLYNIYTPVTILTAGTDWSRVQIGSQVGYMMSVYLSSTSVPVEDPGTPVVYKAFIVSGNGKGVYLRYGPSVADNVIALYPVGTEVKVLKSNGTWDYVSIGSRTGYMMHQFLSTTYVSTALTAVSVSNLNPHVGDTLIAVTTPSGATASYTWLNDLGQVLSTAGSYVVKSSDLGRKIQVKALGTGTYLGNATSSFTQVVTAASVVQQVTGCTLSMTNPRVGDVIKASAVPSGATVTYIWYRKGSVDTYLGTGSTYTASIYDAGASIYAVAIGYNSWTGSVSSLPTAAVLPKADTPLSGTVALPSAAIVGQTLNPSLSLNTYAITYHWYQNGVEVGNLNTQYLTSDMAGSNLMLIVTALSGSGYSGSVSSNSCYVQNAVSTYPSSSISASTIVPEEIFAPLVEAAVEEPDIIPVTDGMAVEWIPPTALEPVAAIEVIP